MKSILVVLVFLLAGHVHAQMMPMTVLEGPEVIEPSTGSTKYDRLVDMFAKGQPITFAEMKGYMSGRCFYTIDKGNPRPSLLGYYERDSNSGPAFEPTSTRVFSIMYPGAAPGYFDNVEMAEVRSDFHRIGEDSWEKINPYTESPTLAYTYDWEANNRPDEQHEFVKSDDFIVSKWTALLRQKYGESGLKNPGDILGMCYYFKRLE